MSNLFQIDHPLVEQHLSELRDRDTPPAEFGRLVHRLAVLLAYEATSDLELRDVTVQTPLCETHGRQLSQRIGLIPILRAGLGMVDPILNLIPGAEVWHLGLYRDEATARPVEYYSKLPGANPVDVALILDPMLATGGSAAVALSTLRRWGVPQIKVLAIIAAPEGIREVQSQFPDTKIHVCAIDERLAGGAGSRSGSPSAASPGGSGKSPSAGADRIGSKSIPSSGPSRSSSAFGGGSSGFSGSSARSSSSRGASSMGSRGGGGRRR